jgi:hypothetical protein
MFLVTVVCVACVCECVVSSVFVMFGWWGVPPYCGVLFLGLSSMGVHTLIVSGATCLCHFGGTMCNSGFGMRGQKMCFMWLPMYWAMYNSRWYPTILGVKGVGLSKVFIWIMFISWSALLRLIENLGPKLSGPHHILQYKSMAPLVESCLIFFGFKYTCYIIYGI